MSSFEVDPKLRILVQEFKELLLEKASKECRKQERKEGEVSKGVIPGKGHALIWLTYLKDESVCDVKTILAVE